MVKLELKPDFEEGGPTAYFNAKHASCSKDGLLVWAYTDSLLEVYFADSDEIVATWRFGKILHDSHTRISCVTDFKYCGGHMLMVATSNLSEQGTLCLFSISKKKVVRAVEFPQRITSLEVLFSNICDDVPSWVISRHLNFFCGLVAVGTQGGYVYLTDLCLDEVAINQSTEIEPKKLSVTGGNLVDPKAKRERARSHNKQLALLLDDQCHREGEYHYRRQDDSIQKVFDETDVHVTCLKFLGQAGTLAVGFNFGCFQMWRLHSPALDYSSRYKPECPAVSHFLLHEPENDPRKLLYLWIATDDSVVGEESSSIATISLYQLCFAKKEFFPNFGLFYDDLETVYFWMDHVLSLDPYSSETRSIWSSQLINAYTITNPLFSPLPHKANDSFEEGLHSHDQSLSLFVWRVDSKQGSGASHYWMAIFDLNRWYHAQMPHAIRCVGTSPQLCPFWAVYKLDEVAACSSPPAILDVHVTGNNVVRFMSSSSLPPLEHSYPSALEMNDVKFITSQRMVKGQCYGWQRQLLHDLAHDGANYLIQPADFFHQCLRARLVPQHHDSEAGLSMDRKRHALLNLSLDYCLIPALIHQCIDLWADGDYAQMGCSLKFLLDWAWNCVSKIKERLDHTSEPLFDWSGQPVNSHTLWTLQHQHRSLTCLSQIFTIFLSVTSPLTQTGELELELRLETIKLLVQHYEVMLWCLSQSLLPEVKEGDTGRQGLFAYPVGELWEVYQKRRQEMAKLQGVVDGYPLLLVDGLVSCEGNQVSAMWENRGGNGLYPPPSMQAAVYLFLLEDISLEVKQAIMLYLLQDLAALCDDQSEALVASFLQRFMIAPSLVHKVQGVWFLDHRDYEEGLRQLISPNVCHHDWSTWVDVGVVNTLLAQGEARTATCFVHSGHSLGETLDEQKLMISVLIRNGNGSQAVEFMRRCFHGNEDSGSLMPHLLKECHEHKLMGQLLQLHFRRNEELHIEQYMRDRTEPNSLEPLFLYYLHSARFVQAFQLNQEMNRMDRMEASLSSQERSSNRNRLMNAYLEVLPDITRKLIVEKQGKTAFMPVKRIRVSQPTPLSTVVHRQSQPAVSRASFVMALMDKVEEAMSVVEDALEEAPQLLGDTLDKDSQCDARFLKTPLTPRSKSFTSSPSKVANPSEISETRLPTNPLSAAKQRTLAGEDGETTAGYKSLHALTMECLSVLKTPSKARTHQSPKLSGLESAAGKTPQSILKVKRITRTSLSRDTTSGSQWKRSSPHTHPKSLGFSQSESAMLSTPSPTSSAKLAEKTPTAVNTPKHLRFIGLSPSPSPSPAVASREMSRSASEDSDEVWTDAMETSVDGQEVKGQQVVEHSAAAENGSAKDSTSVDTGDAIQAASPATGHEKLEMTSEYNTRQRNADIQHVETGGAVELVVETGSPDRYDDSLGKLVRPDLMSPWKHDVSGENACVDGEISFNMCRHGKKESPSASVVITENKAETVGVNTEKYLSYDQEKDPTITLEDAALQRRTATSPGTLAAKSLWHEISASQSMTQPDNTSLPQKLSRSVKQSVHFESKSLNQTLSITTSETVSALQITSTPEKRKRELDSPPMTPPSSKMAKISEMARMKKVASDAQELKATSLSLQSISPVSRKESAEKDMPDISKDVVDRTCHSEHERSIHELPSPKQPKLKTEMAKADWGKLHGEAKVNTEDTPAESDKEEFISSEDFLQQVGDETRASPEIPVSPSRRKSRRLHPTDSSTDSSDDLGIKSARRVTASKQSLAVLSELTSLVESAKPRQRQRGRPKTSERTTYRKGEKEEEIDDNSLRRSQRHSKTPERVMAKKAERENIASKLPDHLPSSTDTRTDDTLAINEEAALTCQDLRRSRRQSKTPERRLQKGKQLENKPLQQTSHEEEAAEHTVKRSQRHSKTPERAVKRNVRHADRSSASESAKESSDERDEARHSIRKSEKHFKVPEVTGTFVEEIELTSHNLRYSSRQSKTPERAIKKPISEEKFDLQKSEPVGEEVNPGTRHSIRQSKTPERAIKKSISEETLESQKLQLMVEKLNPGIRRSTRQSKTPERVTRGLVHKGLVSETDQAEISTHQVRQSRRQSKTPERTQRQLKLRSTEHDSALNTSQGITSGKEEAGETNSDILRHSRAKSKTPERVLKRKVHNSPGKEETSETAERKSRQSRRQSKTPERNRKKTSSEDTSSEREEGREMSTLNIRRSVRHSKTPERLISSIEGAVRKSNRAQQTPEKLNTPEIESLTDVSHSPKRQHQKLESPVTPPVQLSMASADQMFTTPTRKSTRPLKSPERLNTDQIEPVEKSTSPNRSSRTEKKSPVGKPDGVESAGDNMEEGETKLEKKTEESKVTDSPSKQSKKDGREDETEEAEGQWRDDMPPLRFEVEEEEMREEEGPEHEAPPSFVFSPPVRYGTRSHDSGRHQEKKQKRGDEEAAFLFSMPMSATSEPAASTASDAEAVDSSESGSVAKRNDGQEKKRVTRKKKKLYQDTPKLLSPLTELETERKMKAKTRRESQQTSMNVTRRYSRGPGPLTRRVRPSSRS